MTQIRRILVPVDFSATSDIALRYAIDMAARLSATIHLIHVIEAQGYTAPSDGYRSQRASRQWQVTKELQRQLTETTTRCVEGGVEAIAHIVSGKPAAVVVEQAFERGIDLIVMGTHGRSGVAHLLLGSVAERVVRSAPCPVLTVRDTPRVADALSVAFGG